MPKPSFEQLVDLAEGRLPAAEALALRQQIAADPAAAADVAALEDLFALIASDEGEDAPEYVIARALRLVRPLAPAQPPSLLERIVAVLRSDSRQRPLAAGLRSGEATTRSMSYSAEAWEMDLELAPRAGGWQLRGQLLGPELAGTIELRGEQSAQTATINALGEFTLPPVPPGSYALVVRLDARELVIEQLELGL